MSFVLYVYVPTLAEAEVHAMLQVLTSCGYSMSHLGKKDPPKKWVGTVEEAAATILYGNDGTLWTFIKDAKQQLDVTVEIHRDSRWKHSTISASLPDEVALRRLGECFVGNMSSFASVIGRSGVGKSPGWKIIHIAHDCPAELRARIE